MIPLNQPVSGRMAAAGMPPPGLGGAASLGGQLDFQFLLNQVSANYNAPAPVRAEAPSVRPAEPVRSAGPSSTGVEPSTSGEPQTLEAAVQPVGEESGADPTALPEETLLDAQPATDPLLAVLAAMAQAAPQPQAQAQPLLTGGESGAAAIGFGGGGVAQWLDKLAQQVPAALANQAGLVESAQGGPVQPGAAPLWSQSAIGLSGGQGEAMQAAMLGGGQPESGPGMDQLLRMAAGAGPRPWEAVLGELGASRGGVGKDPAAPLLSQFSGGENIVMTPTSADGVTPVTPTAGVSQHLAATAGTAQAGTAGTASGATLSVYAADFPDQLAGRVGRMQVISRPGQSDQVRITLDPRELGEVRMRLQVDNDHRVHLMIHTDTEAAREVLKGQLGQLRESLVRQNLEFGDVLVQVGPEQQQQQQQRGGEPDAGGYRGGRLDEVAPDGPWGGERPAPTVQHYGLVGGGRGLSVMA